MLDFTEVIMGMVDSCEAVVNDGTNPTPMTSKQITVDGKTYWLCVIHPEFHKRIVNASVLDPRSTLE